MFWGHKTLAWFDVWSIEHFISGITIYGFVSLVVQRTNIGTKIFGYNNINNSLKLLILLAIAYIWEVTEHYLENGTSGIDAITYWFQGVEFWGNRLITDPLLMILGALLVIRYKLFIWPARIFSALWLFFHIVIFPHSMYLHSFL